MKKKHYIILAVVVVIAIAAFLIYHYWDKISSLWFGTKSNIPECNSLGLDQSQIDILKSQGKCITSGGRMAAPVLAVSDIPARFQDKLTDAEKNILATLYANVNRLALADADPNQTRILVAKANDQLSSIGSKLSIAVSVPGEVMNKPCPCSGWTINIGIFTFRHCVKDC